tara:strand:- start:2466 stop:4247 length:1782 start_codon:yes stop_codon:yes gene_type:complete
MSEDETTQEKYKRILKSEGKEAAREALGVGSKKSLSKKGKKAKSGAPPPVPKPSFKGKGGVNCWVRYNNSGARYITCGTYSGSGTAPPPIKKTPLISPATFIGMMGKSGYNDLSSGQQREYHRLVMANRRAEERENSEMNAPEYKKFLEGRREDAIEFKKEVALDKAKTREEDKISRSLLKKGATARTDEDIDEFYEIHEQRELKESGFVKTNQKELQKAKDEIEKRYESKINDDDIETEAIKTRLSAMGESGRYKPVFGEAVRKIQAGETKRDLEAFYVESPWGVEYNLEELTDGAGGTNLNLILQLGLSGQTKNIKKNVGAILQEAYDEVYKKVSPANRKNFKPDDDEFQEAFEDAMDKAWKTSQYGLKPTNREDVIETEKILQKAIVNEYKQEQEGNLQNELSGIESAQEKKKSQEQKRIEEKYKNRVAKARNKLKDAIRLAEEKNIPAGWVQKNVRIVFDDETGDPLEGDYLKKMVEKVGNSYAKVEALDGTLEELKEAVKETQLGIRKGTIFSKGFYEDIDNNIKKAQKRIRELEKEEKVLKKFLKKQAFASGKKFEPPASESEKMEKILDKLKKDAQDFMKNKNKKK